MEDSVKTRLFRSCSVPVWISSPGWAVTNSNDSTCKINVNTEEFLTLNWKLESHFESWDVFSAGKVWPLALQLSCNYSKETCWNMAKMRWIRRRPNLFSHGRYRCLSFSARKFSSNFKCGFTLLNKRTNWEIEAWSEKNNHLFAEKNHWELKICRES